MTGNIAGWVAAKELGSDLSITEVIERLAHEIVIVEGKSGPQVVQNSVIVAGSGRDEGAKVIATVPALEPHQLGTASFRQAHNVSVALIAGAMANGIASTELVIAMARAGMMGFFGAAGLNTKRITKAIATLKRELVGLPWGVNLIHSPAEPWQEQQTVDLLIKEEVTKISASAYMKLTPMLVQYRVHGLHRNSSGTIVSKNHIFAKVSRAEVAVHFLRPAPKAMLEKLVKAGLITALEAELGAQVPVACDLTAESDSGGHTDNRPLGVLLPVLRALADRVALETNSAPARIGAAGGLGHPAAIASAFMLGADYVMTGSVNQTTLEAGTSPMAKELLAKASMADVTMAPASDMFEAGVSVQVLSRGTLFASRGRALYQLYRDHSSIDSIDETTRKRLEKSVFKMPLQEVWSRCEAFFAEVDEKQLQRANTDPKHKLALICRWYLGKSSRWAIDGTPDRLVDAQVWCGPAIGSFNDWTAGSFLQAPENRTAAAVSSNLMAGAAAHIRRMQLRFQGIETQPYVWKPRPLRSSL